MNRIFLGLLLCVLSQPASAGERGPLADLVSLRWEHRLVVVKEPRDIDSLLSRLEAETAGITERKVAWFILDGDQLHTNFSGEMANSLAAHIRAHTDFRDATMVLIGLDGGIKLRLTKVDLNALYSAIDAMPMRRYERLR